MTASAVCIRQAVLADLETLVANNLAMATETEDRRLDEPTVRRGTQAVFDDASRGVYYVAERDGTVVGQLLITREWSDWRNGWFWWIQSVYVSPVVRGQGVYRALYAHIEETTRAMPDVCGLRLYVDHQNTAAQNVYERLGMQRASYAFYEVDWSAGPSERE